ncbi:GDNF-inducible zinc finger protein 1 [Dunckerocampus dactyliophorus]|uniref:GDNF-inducible zinc finger protein 1 n=1 Tax=Dunckerocampus dactyliophorus TaxID=161453 RepID=UPI002406D9C6|nr:GDNF-inducible zinc finger protein 1 [Dunckerocampus dactyliophorus]
MMGTGVVQLTSTSHHEHILDSLHHLRLQGHFSDVTVQVEHQGDVQVFQAHQVILAASSGYFKNILLSQDAARDNIPLSNMQPGDFSTFLEFVYTGKLVVTQSKLVNIEEVARLLDCKELLKICGAAISAGLLQEPTSYGSNSDAGETPAVECAAAKSSSRKRRKLAPKSSEKLSKRSNTMETDGEKERLGGHEVVEGCVKTSQEALKEANKVSDEEEAGTPTESDESWPPSPPVDVVDVGPDDEGSLSLYHGEEPLLSTGEEDEEEENGLPKRKPRFLCNSCHRTFFYERCYMKHVSTYHGVKADLVYRCKTCLQTFSNRSNLKIHEKHVHSTERQFSCDVCAKTFKRKKDVVRHYQQVHDPQYHQCPDCGKSLSSKASLELHKKIHSGVKPFACSECGARFTQNSALKMHQRVHTGEKPFYCDKCDARFSQKSMLVYHKRSHTGERPFMCEACGKSFASKEYLRNHSNIHTGTKPFKCEQCGRCFAQRNSLRQHLTIHTGERPYACTFCNKQFTQLNALQRHQRIHTGEKPYMCGMCSRTFSDKSTLRRHTATHDSSAPWKNYLVVLEGNVEKRAKVASKAPTQGKKTPVRKGDSRVHKTNAEAVVVAEPVALPSEWAGHEAIALVSHAHLGGITVIHTEVPLGTQLQSVVTPDNTEAGVVASDGSAVPVPLSESEASMSSVLEAAASLAVLAPVCEASARARVIDPDIQPVIVNHKICDDAQNTADKPLDDMKGEVKS